ncbi:MAG: APC family permease [Clostridia bacterium]|nr:APC family permease [Clostridia bacterium]
MSTKKKFKLMDAILTVICVVFVAEAAAPVASIGNSQFFWWILMIIAFLLPYGLISSELGTTYNGDGGLYDWVRAAYPNGKTAGRVAWYYWINYPLWMASLAVLCPDLITIITGIEFGSASAMMIQLVFVWLVVVISFFPAGDSAWILNGGAIIKVLLALIMGGLGIYGAMTHGVANEYTVASLLPSFDSNSLSYISVIIFNCLGFEVICTLTDSMDNPKRDIPKSIITGGIVIAAIYIFCAFGIGVAIPTDQISADTGLLDAMILLTGKTSGLFISLMALLFMMTLFGNMISWALGVNNVAAYAADHNDLPKVYAKRSGKNDMPTGAAVMNGIVATIVVIIGGFLPNSNLFWSFFSLNLVMFLISYVPIFPAFLKLRKIDPDRERPFKAPGSAGMLKVIAIVPMILIVVSIIFTALPLSFDAETLEATLPITIGSVVFFIIGEVIIHTCRKKHGAVYGKKSDTAINTDNL